MGRLFWKVLLAFWGVLLIASLLVGFSVWLYRPDHQGGRHIPGGPGASIITGTAAAVLKQGGEAAVREFDQTLQEYHEPFSLRVITPTGKELFGRPVSSEELAEAQNAADNKPRLKTARMVESPTGERYLVFLSNNEQSNAHRLPPIVLEDMPPLHPGSSDGFHGPPPRDRAPYALIAVGLFSSLVFSTFLAWYLSKPIRHLRSAFEALSKGKLETRVQPLIGNRRDELADLGRDFDHMSQHLQALMSTQQRLLHDVSHELRSPLARLQAAISLTRQNPDKINQTLDRIDLEVHRLDQLVGELLTLARLENQSNGHTRQWLDLVELVADIAEDARFEAELQHKHVSFNGQGDNDGDIMTWGSGELLYRAVENIIRNAVHHTRENTTVDIVIRTAEDKQYVSIIVSDQGNGVPAHELETIFEPFFRSENGQKGSGYGLGLAIAQRAIIAHGGKITASNRAEGGLEMDITFPLQAKPFA